MEPSSLLYRPLDWLVGRVSHVRVLRVLSLHGGGFAPTELARRAGLSRRGAWNAIASLQETGLVEPVGTGHSVPFRLSEGHPLAETIRGLFEDEAARADAVLEAIRAAASALQPRPVAVWLFGSVARAEDRLGSDLDVAVVAESEEAARDHAERLREMLEEIAERWAIAPSVVSLSRSEVRRLSGQDSAFWRRLVRDGVPLVGPAPEMLAGSEP